jgi:small conductance mechanosensitive channel
VGVSAFAESSVNIAFNLWFEKSNLWNLKDSILVDIKTTFDSEGIEIPYKKIDVQIKDARKGE